MMCPMNSNRQNNIYRFMLYNIRYAAGTGWTFHLPFPWSGYIRKTHRQFTAITDFIKSCNPDIVGLVEVDGGSFRSGKVNQAHSLAEEMDHFAVFQGKYSHTSLSRFCPIMRKQGNAFLAKDEMISQRYHYFNNGIKRLVIEIEMDEFMIMLVHLSIHYKHRQEQLRTLSTLIKNIHKPVMVAGDFNIFKGADELKELYQTTHLRNANIHGAVTFPSKKPKWELDLILHSPEISIKKFSIPNVVLSDHLPVMCDFTVSQ